MEQRTISSLTCTLNNASNVLGVPMGFRVQIKLEHFTYHVIRYSTGLSVEFAVALKAETLKLELRGEWKLGYLKCRKGVGKTRVPLEE